MKGRMRPYLPELTIRDYNTYMRYLRGVRRQMYKSYGFYACHLLRTNGVLFAILSDSLAGRMPTCKRQRMPGTPFQRSMMCQTLGIRQAAQTEILMAIIFPIDFSAVFLYNKNQKVIPHFQERTSI